MGMPATTRHLLPLLSAGQAQKEIAHNEALVALDHLLHPVVEDIGINVPPADPHEGQGWIIGEAPTEAWAGRAGQIAWWTIGGWRFSVPFEGLNIWHRATAYWLCRRGGAWEHGTLHAQALHVGGEKVVGARTAAIPEPEGGAVIDEFARNAITAILTSLKAHGLISS